MSSDGHSRAVDAQQILRSINVTLDSASPERIAHFVPTAKSTKLLHSWLLPGHSSSYFVVAPYGTGKSLAAAFFIQVVENLKQSRDVLGRITERFSDVDAALTDELRSRVHSDQGALFVQRGATVALSGFQSDLPAAIRDALVASLTRTGNRDAAASASRHRANSMNDVVKLLSEIRDRFCPDPIDRLAIVWDEFGRHLEELVTRGTAASLADIQTLAEFCARTKRVPTTFALLLHQGLSRYATNTSVTVQREWKKIEGRFETIQFVDDSKELYQIVGQIMRQIRSSKRLPRKALTRGLLSCQKVGLFGDFSPEETEQILSDAYPLEPVTLYLLPRVSSRVAQNERTLFTYLYSLVTGDSISSSPVSPGSMYDYFSDAMRSDSLPGGSYHTWLETESALHKADSAIDQETLKCACLLGLGLVGERSRVSRKLLESAVSGYRSVAAARDSVKRLIASNLLLYRVKADNVSIWHGTDLDLRGRLEQEKQRLGPRFDHVAFLASEAPPAPWKSTDYNVEFGTERYFESRYVAAQAIVTANSVAEVLPSSSADGMLFVVVPESHEELGEVRKRLDSQNLGPSVVVAMPRHADRVAEAALDVYALQLLRQDTSLLAEDPLVEPELAQMIDDAQGYLNLHLARMFHPSAEGPEYRWRDRYYAIASPKELRQFLSSIMREVYPLTPRIMNEVIVRRRPRPAIVNARKKLILGILERSGTESLGLEGYRPDMSMFRTVLLLTGLYRCHVNGRDGEDATWRYAAPEELKDEGLRLIWEHVRDYLTTPSDQPKPLADLIAQIGTAPYGVRAGVIPILLAAGLRAFPGPISITALDGSYVSDLLPSTIEAMAAHPHEYQVLVPDLAAGQREFLDQVAVLFGSTEETTTEADPVRRCHDALATWRSTLPHSALSSRYLSTRASSFGRLLTIAVDPYRVLFEALPSVLNLSSTDVGGLLLALAECKAEIEGVLQWNYEAASRAIRSAFPVINGDDATLRDIVGTWVDFFPGSVAHEVKDGIAQALISRARMHYDTDQALADALAALIVGKRIVRWEDSSIVVFERELGAVIRRVEDTVLSLSTRAGGVHSQSIVDIATSRLQASLRAIANAVGPDGARTITVRALKQITKEGSTNGSPERSTRSTR